MEKSYVRSYHFSKSSQWRKVPKSTLAKCDSRIRENYSIRIADTNRKGVMKEIVLHHRKPIRRKTHLGYKKVNSIRRHK